MPSLSSLATLSWTHQQVIGPQQYKRHKNNFECPKFLINVKIECDKNINECRNLQNYVNHACQIFATLEWFVVCFYAKSLKFCAQTMEKLLFCFVCSIKQRIKVMPTFQPTRLIKQKMSKVRFLNFYFCQQYLKKFITINSFRK